MLKLIVAFLGCAVALTSACCTPDQWEGGAGSVVGYAGFIKKGLIKEYSSVAYDYKNKRSASTLYYQNGKIRAKYSMLARYCDEDQDCGKGKLYIVNEDRQRCYVKTLRSPFRKACVPKEARRQGDFYFGLKGGLKATSYELDGRNFEATISVSSVDKDVCVPLGEVIAKKGRYTTLRDSGFVNITPGIKNATIFDVPEICKGVMESDDVAVVNDLMDNRSFFIL